MYQTVFRVFDPKPFPSDTLLQPGVYIQEDAGLLLAFPNDPRIAKDIAFISKLGSYPQDLLPKVIADLLHRQVLELLKAEAHERPLAIPEATWEPV